MRRFICIWFNSLKTDWYTVRHPNLKSAPFVLTASEHGRMVVTAVNEHAIAAGAFAGMVLTDARSMIPSLEAIEEPPDLLDQILRRIAYWCIRYSPVVGIDKPDCIILEATGCCHLWKGEEQYVHDIINRLKRLGYNVRVAMADTIGAAWAIAHFGREYIVPAGETITALLPLHPAALRLENEVIARLQKLGFRQIQDFITIPHTTLRRRFGASFVNRLNQVLGHEEELIEPVHQIEPYEERLPCLEPIATRTGIEIALKNLLETMCYRLQREQKGLRKAIFTGCRIDGDLQKIEIGTTSPSHNPVHLFNLFDLKLGMIEPGLGIEVFILQAPIVETTTVEQEELWRVQSNLDHADLSELLDRVAGKLGANNFYRYLPAEHYLPERSIKRATSLSEKPKTTWGINRPRPLLLQHPKPIEVTAPIPDYPPMLFRYQGKLHKVVKADGPERVEQEWWLQEGEHRDYYYVEDEDGQRYWLFRSGHYDADKQNQWFIHGFFP